MRLGGLKLIRTRDGDELYNLSQDPGELKNIAATHADTIRQLEVHLPAEGSGAGANELDEETKKQLEALGYVQ